MSTPTTDVYKEIYQAADTERLLEFFKTVTPEQKEEIATEIPNIYSIDKPKTSEGKRNILALSAICCMGVEYQFEYWDCYIHPELVKRLLDIYVPEWASEFLNRRMDRKGNLWCVDYAYMMDLQKKGHITIEKEMLLTLLLQAAFIPQERNPVGWINHTCDMTLLLKHPETVNEHIWLLFEEETGINKCRESRKTGDRQWENYDWLMIFDWLIENKHINKHDVLKACLSTANRNFTKPLIGWFVDLFEYIKPSKEDILSLQEELIGVFNSPQTKPQNNVLKHFKKICTDKAFNKDLFLENVNTLLSSETKGVLNSTLQILDKLANKNKDLQSRICVLASLALLFSDKSVQEKVAKLILKYSTAESVEIKESIAVYADVLLSDTKSLLSEYLVDGQVNSEMSEECEEQPEKLDISAVLSDDNRIAIPETVDDFVFYITQMFDTPSATDFDIFIDCMVRFTPEMKDGDIDKFAPTLKRVQRIASNYGTPRSGMIEGLLVIAYMEYCSILIGKYPDSCKLLKKQYEKCVNDHEKHRKENEEDGYTFTPWLYPVEEWINKGKKSNIVKLFHYRISKALELVRDNRNLPLIAIPTHNASWIDPKVLVDRVKQWQSAGQKIDDIEIQIAFARTFLEDANHLISVVKENIKGEYKDILCFLFDKKSSPQVECNDKVLWWTAAQTKTPYKVYDELKDSVYAQMPRLYFNNEYRCYTELEEVTYYDKTTAMVPRIYLHSPSKDELTTVYDEIRNEQERGESIMIFEHFGGGWDEAVDVRRYLSLIPNNNENMLEPIFTDALARFRDYEEKEKRIATATLETLYEHQLSYGPTAQYIIALLLMASDKTIRSLSAATLLQGILTERIDNELIGKGIAVCLFHSKYPVKRLTDIISSDLIGTSSIVDTALKEILETAFSNMNDEPIKNHKKMLELYYEVVQITKLQPNTEYLKKLDIWRNTKSLQKVIKQIEAMF